VSIESNVPATTQEEPALPATIDGSASEAPTRPGQNVMTGLFPLAIGVLVLLFLTLALWTVMTVTPSGV
jgi:hypothetical protein